MGKIEDFAGKHLAISTLILVPVLVVMVGGLLILAVFEEAFMWLKGYSWDPYGYGYLHRKTGHRA